MKATGVVTLFGVYFSACFFTTILNLTVVILAGVVLSETLTVTIFSSRAFVFSTTPVIVWLNGFVSVALSLDSASSLSALLALLNQTPLGTLLPVKPWILPVLSDAFTVTFAFSPRYTVTFGKFASEVPSVNETSWPLSPTNLTVGLTVSFTLSVTGIILYFWTLLAIGPVSDTFGNVTFT